MLFCLVAMLYKRAKLLKRVKARPTPPPLMQIFINFQGQTLKEGEQEPPTHNFLSIFKVINWY